MGRTGARDRHPASKLSLAVYAKSTLGLREFEAARLRIAQINGCIVCMDWRTDRDGEKVEDGFFEAVENWRPQMRSTTAPAWLPSTRSGTRSITTTSTTSSGRG